MSNLGFNTIWRPGVGTQRIRWNMSENDFKFRDTAYFNQGLRITSFDIENGKLCAVWQPGFGTQWVKWGMSSDEFKSFDQSYLDQGLRITCLEIDHGNIAAVWRPGSGTQWVVWDMSWEDFKKFDKTYLGQGLRIKCLSVVEGNFAAVWRPGTGTQWIHYNMTFDELASEDRAYLESGLRMKILLIDAGRYTAVWQPGSGTQWCSTERCDVDFKTEDSAYLVRGLRVMSLKLCNSTFGAYKYPWQGGIPFMVGQGNNNASGSHNGSQAYAFDFSMPSGIEIRAARGGVVEWLRESQTSNYNPSQPKSPANKPYPDNDLRNWGNALRIRHAGGFTSWYFHLQTNSVVVNVGDVVSQGQVIAKCDNTGQSTGPHLHFQVQSDSDDWGQSVPITFGANCEQPLSGDLVQSDNAS